MVSLQVIWAEEKEGRLDNEDFDVRTVGKTGELLSDMCPSKCRVRCGVGAG